MATVPIPLTTINPPGFSTAGVAVPSTLDHVILSVDRTVGTQPINGDVTLVISIEVHESFDGTTWFLVCAGGVIGGPQVGDDGNLSLTSAILVDFTQRAQSLTRQVRAHITTNNTFTVSGTVTTV